MSIPPPGIPAVDYATLRPRDILGVLLDNPAYRHVRGFSEYLESVGHLGNAEIVRGLVDSWCHYCNSPGHPCPTPIHLNCQPLDGSTANVVYVRCKRSSCPHCGPIYVAEWRDQLEDDLAFWLALAPRFKVYWFTQTWNPATEPLPFSAPEAHKRVTVLFRDLVRHFRRNRPRGLFEYATVIEPHKSGQIHVHAFLVVEGDEMRPRCTAQHRGGYNRHRPPAERLPEGSCICHLTGSWEPCIGRVAESMGWGINNLQRLTTHVAASKYLTKRLGSYMTKTVQHCERPKYARALRMSRGFPVEPHYAYKARRAAAHIRRLTELGKITERGPAVWTHIGAWSHFVFKYSDRFDSAEVVPILEARYDATPRPPPAPPPPPAPLTLPDLF